MVTFRGQLGSVQAWTTPTLVSLRGLLLIFRWASLSLLYGSPAGVLISTNKVCSRGVQGVMRRRKLFIAHHAPSSHASHIPFSACNPNRDDWTQVRYLYLRSPGETRSTEWHDKWLPVVLTQSCFDTSWFSQGVKIFASLA